MPLKDQEYSKSSQAEAVHIGVLAASIAGNQKVYSSEEALNIVKMKIATLSEENKNHP